MKVLVTYLVLIVACLPISETRANGLIQKLPKDGSWVRYHIVIKMGKPQKMEITGMVTIRSVGRETVKDEPCRWIEIQMKAETGGMKINHIDKILVSEKVFRKGKKVSTKIIRGWEKENDNPPQKLTDSQKSNEGPLAMFLPDSERKIEKINEKKTVNYKKGTLEIETGAISSPKLDLSEIEGENVTSLIIFSVWSHEKVPFRSVFLKIDGIVKKDQTIINTFRMTFTLEDFGTGAKSALPDHN